jgi:hypothetical protein
VTTNHVTIDWWKRTSVREDLPKADRYPLSKIIQSSASTYGLSHREPLRLPYEVRNPTDLSTPWKESPQLSLALDSSPDLDGVRKKAASLIPGETIYGHLDITCRRSFHVYQVSVFLEGELESWSPIFAHSYRQGELNGYRDFEELGCYCSGK